MTTKSANVREATLLLQDKEKAFETDDSDDETEAEDSPWQSRSNSGGEPSPGDRPGYVSWYVTPSSARLLPTETQKSSQIPLNKPIGEMAQLRQSIGFTINCLSKMPTQRPDSLDQPKQPPTDVSTYEQSDIQDVKKRLPNLDPEVATRSGEDISCRPQLPIYGLSHRELPQIPENLPGTVAPAPPIVEQAAREATASEINESRAADSGHAGAMTLRTPATTRRANTSGVETLALCLPSPPGFASPLESSCASSSLCVEVPPRPKRDNGKELETFECPYCLEPQRIKTDHAWK